MSAEAASTAQLLLDLLPLLNRAVVSTIQVDEPDALTMPQFRVLAHLSDGPKTVSELARRRRVTLASMGQLAQALVERGLVDRRPDPQDRRQYQLSLSPAGQERYAATYTLALHQLATLLSERLDSSDLAALQTVLPRLHYALADQ